MDKQNIKSQLHPFKCYFCNKLIENDTEYGHISNCGSVLEPCVNKCGSYVPRNLRSKHSRECKNRLSKSTNRLSLESDSYDSKTVHDSRIMYNPAILPTSTMPKSASASKIDLTEIRYKIYSIEQLCQQLSQNLLILQTNQQDSNQKQDNSRMQLKMHFEKLQYQIKILSEWKRSLELQMEKFKNDLDLFTKFQNDTKDKVDNLKSMRDVTHQINADIKLMQIDFQKDQLKNQESINDLKEKLNEFKDYFAQENAVVGALWNDSRIETDKLKNEISITKKSLEDVRTKNTSIVFDLRAVSQVSSESADQLEIQQRTIDMLQKEIAQLKLDIDQLDGNNSVSATNDFPGRLLWKISNFSKKMEIAKENDTILRSPIFYTHTYGYKIRLHLYLNGIKKWKGRHMIACLHVLKGDYDLLLKWPCNIEGTLVLKDLYNQMNPTNFSKYICAKRYLGDEENEEPQESSTQYIFVPHSTLLKQNFVKEDTLFIEIKITSSNKLRNETEL